MLIDVSYSLFGMRSDAQWLVFFCFFFFRDLEPQTSCDFDLLDLWEWMHQNRNILWSSSKSVKSWRVGPDDILKKGVDRVLPVLFLAEEFSSEEGTSCSVVTSGCWSKSTSPWQVAEELHTNGMKVRYSLNSCRLDAFETVHVVQPLAAGCVALSSHESRTRCRCRERINIPYSSLLPNWMVWIFEQRTLQFPES